MHSGSNTRTTAANIGEPPERPERVPNRCSCMKPFRKTSIGAVLVAIGQLCSPPAPAADPANREWHFRVTLDGKAIGNHRFTLSEEGAMRRMVSEARFRVRILFVDAYRY